MRIRMPAIGLVCLLSVTLGAAAGADPPPATELTVSIDGHDTGKVFEGIGALSSGGTSRLLYDYPEPQRGQILDYLFKPGYGASLQHLKVEIGGDANSSNGSEASYRHLRDEPADFERGYEWWLMLEAKRRNPNITLSALEWSVPGWVGNGNYFSTDNLDYIVGFIEGAKRRYGLTIDYVGTVNEPRVIHQTVDWNWVKRLKRTLVAHRLPTKLVVGDDPRRGCCPSYLPWDDVNAMAADPALAAAVDVIGSHYAGGVVPATAYRFGKPIWSSEDGPWTDAWNAFTGGSFTALGSTLNRNYVNARMTATHLWNLASSYYDNLLLPNSGLLRASEPWSGHYDVASPVWVTAHTTQFARPGWRYLDHASVMLPKGGSMVTLVSPNHRDLSTVIETQRTADNTIPAAAQTLRFQVSGELAGAGVVHVWKSTASAQFVRQQDIPVVGGAYQLTVEPDAMYSVTTTTGQHRGNSEDPVTVPFPHAYSDNFDLGNRGQQPKYLAQQGGSFELTPCRGGRRGQCVEQVVGEQPVEWFQAYPTAYLGDSAGWTDLSVETKVLHGLEGAAEVWARIGNNGVNSTGISMPVLPDGYYLSVEKTGRWYLGKTVDGERRQLAAGFIELPPNQWHSITISAVGTTLTALIDGRSVGTATDATYGHGRAGIGTGWNRVQFDDFTVTPK